MRTSAQHRSRLFSAIAAGGIALGLTLLTAGPAAAVADAEVALSATTATTVGDVVTVTVGLVDVVDVTGYAITLSYDPAVVRYTADSVAAGPTGGFDSVQVGVGTATLVHTRLGTSPALVGTQPANTLAFVVIGPGDARITASLELIGSDGVSTVVPNAAATPSNPVVAAVPPATVTPGTGGTTSPADTTPAAAAATAAPRPGSLSLTGIDSGYLLALAAAGVGAIAVGFLVVRRRTAANR